MSISLLWTGGWDSTFRLLQLLCTTHAPIRPLYLVDDERASAPQELATMRRIRRALRDHVPNGADRLLPTAYGSFRGTTIAPTVRADWRALSRQGYRLGIQYPILATYAAEHDIEDLELSIEARDASQEGSIASLLAPNVVRASSPGGPTWRLPDSVDGPLRMFRRFTFPLLHHTKREMEREADGFGLASVLYDTWFCLTPVFGRPCGRCHPCRVAVAEGFSRRVGRLGPTLRRLRSGLQDLRTQPRHLHRIATDWLSALRSS